MDGPPTLPIRGPDVLRLSQDSGGGSTGPPPSERPAFGLFVSSAMVLRLVEWCVEGDASVGDDISPSRFDVTSRPLKNRSSSRSHTMNVLHTTQCMASETTIDATEVCSSKFKGKGICIRERSCDREAFIKPKEVTKDNSLAVVIQLSPPT